MGSGISGRFSTTAGGGCFVAGTLILTEEGLKPIEEIKTGDFVYSKNVKTGETGLKRVLETFQYTANELICLQLKDIMIKVTSEHPFWIYEKGFICAKELDKNSLLTNAAQLPVSIDEIKKITLPKCVSVYNFHVEDFCTYYVSKTGILVHNQSKKKNDKYKTPTKGSGKERATDIPSWAKGKRPYKGESGKDFAKRLCHEHFGEGNYPIGTDTAYNQLRKNGDRGYK